MKRIKNLLLFMVLLNIFYAFFFLFQVNVYAITEENATYEEISLIDEKTLDYNVKYSSHIAKSTFDLKQPLKDQVNNVLEIPSNSGIKITSATNILPYAWKRGQIKDIAIKYEKDNPGYKVIGIVNCDFFDISGVDAFPYQPDGLNISFGNVYKGGLSKGNYNVLSFKNDGSVNPVDFYLNKKIIRRSTPTIAVYNEANEIIKTFETQNVNSIPSKNEISVYYGSYILNGDLKVYNAKEMDKTNFMSFVCDNAIYSLINNLFDYYGLGQINSFEPKRLKEGEFGIVSDNQELNSILKDNTLVRIQYEYENVVLNDAVSCGTQIVSNGTIVKGVNTTDGSRLNSPHPRTALGIKDDGTVVLLVNDGRQQQTGRNGTYGNELACIMKQYGCVNAFNLDGGGSSIMYYRNNNGEFVLGSSPSDGLRSVSNCVIVSVKDPVVNINIINNNPKNFKLGVNIVNKENHDFTDLYVNLSLNSTIQTYKVEDNQIESNNLTDLKIYDLSMYYLDKNGKKVFLITKHKISTDCYEVKIRSLKSISDNDVVKLKLDFTDRSKATNLNNCKLYLDKDSEEYFEFINGSLEIPLDKWISRNQTKLEYVKKITDGNSIEYIINPYAPFINILVSTLDEINNNVIDIYR